MDAYIDGFLDYLARERQASAHTVNAYAVDLRQFCDYLQRSGRTDPDDWDATLWEGFMHYLRRRSMSESSIARKLSAARAFLKHLYRRGVLEHEPPDALATPRVHRALPSTLTPHELRRLLLQPPLDTPYGLRDRAMLETMYTTGMRVSELLGLTLEQLNLSEALVRVVGKRGRERWLPLPDQHGPLAAAVSQRRAPQTRPPQTPLQRAVSERPRRAAEPNQLLEQTQRVCRQRGHRESHLTAHPAPLVRRASAQWRGRPPRRAGTARTRRHQHDPNLHPSQPRPPQRGLQKGASKGVNDSSYWDRRIPITR
jgi:integrase